MSVITLESLLKESDLDENDLNVEIEKEHYTEISRSLTKWSELVLKLEAFDDGAAAAIEANKHCEEDRRLEFLKQLKQKLSFNATYGLLVRKLLEIQRAEDARKLCRHLKSLIGSKGDEEVATAQLEKLKNEDEQLEKKFDKVVQVVQTSLLKRDVVLSEILSSLQFIKSHKEKKMVKQQFKELLEAQSLHVLFFTFSDIWNYMYPGLLEFIVERFGTASDINTVKEYKEDLEKYRRKVKLGDFVKIYKETNPPLYNKKLSTVVGDDWRCKTLQDLEDVRLKFADKTKCDKMILRALPEESQFTIVFSMPSWIQLNLVELYPVLSTIGASKIFLNNDYIYECVPLKKEAADSSKMEKLQSLQCDISKERMCRFFYISDSDFEDLIKNISSDLKEKDLKAILALKWDYYINKPRDVLLDMFQKGQIMKFAPSTFQSVLKRIERMDLIPIIDDFYKYHNKPKVISDDTVHHHFESLHILLKSIRYSLWDLESDYKIAALTSLSSELENICYQAYNTYESIQNAVLEFTEMQSMEEEVMMKLQKLEIEATGKIQEEVMMKLLKLEVEATGKIQPHRLTELRTELSSIKEHQRRRERITMRNDSINDDFWWWDSKRMRMDAMLRKQERKIEDLLGEPEERVMEEDMEAELQQLKFITSELLGKQERIMEKEMEGPAKSTETSGKGDTTLKTKTSGKGYTPLKTETSGKGDTPLKTETSGKGDTPLKDTSHEDVY